MRIVVVILTLLLQLPAGADPKGPMLKQDVQSVFPYALGVPDRCMGYARAAARLATDYRAAVIGYLKGTMPASNAKAIHQSEIELLNQLEAQQPSCYASVANYHSIFGMVLGESMTAVPIAVAQYAMAYLSYRGRLVPVSRIQRGQIGQAWMDRDPKNGGYLMLGAYDCSSETIYYDPTLPQFDLTATLLHELSHLMREQSWMADDNRALWDGDSRGFVLLDESFSSMEGAIYQIFIRHLWNDSGKFNPDELSDLTLFSPNGNMNLILRSFIEGWQGKFGLVAQIRDLIPGMDSLYWRFSRPSKPPSSLSLGQLLFDHEKTNTRVLGILTAIADVYFPHADFDVADLFEKAVLKRYLILNIDPISSDSNSVNEDPDYDHMPEELRRHFFSPDVSIEEARHYLDSETINKHLSKPTLRVIQEIQDRIDSRYLSFMCDKYVKDSKNGRFDDYIGRRVPVPPRSVQLINQQPPPTWPGNEGSKPEIPVKPGNEGSKPEVPVKPGNEGSKPEVPVRPGNEGSKPEIPARPCVRLNEAL